MVVKDKVRSIIELPKKEEEEEEEGADGGIKDWGFGV